MNFTVHVKALPLLVPSFYVRPVPPVLAHRAAITLDVRGNDTIAVIRQRLFDHHG